jgi:flagella basal body P-ring formation protein FlgA
MLQTLTQQELTELKMRFNGITVNESLQYDSIVHTLSSGRIIKGTVDENRCLQIKAITNFLVG